jgi:hypothetical protein
MQIGHKLCQSIHLCDRFCDVSIANAHVYHSVHNDTYIYIHTPLQFWSFFVILDSMTDDWIAYLLFPFASQQCPLSSYYTWQLYLQLKVLSSTIFDTQFSQPEYLCRYLKWFVCLIMLIPRIFILFSIFPLFLTCSFQVPNGFSSNSHYVL